MIVAAMMICGEKCEATTTATNITSQHSQPERKRNASEKWRRIIIFTRFDIFPFCVGSSIVLVFMRLFLFLTKRQYGSGYETHIGSTFSAHYTRTNLSDKLEKQITQANMTILTQHQLARHSHIQFFSITVTRTITISMYTFCVVEKRENKNTAENIFGWQTFPHTKIFPWDESQCVGIEFMLTN